jgi:glycosyltransferase involved in cell wall biosynthesis
MTKRLLLLCEFSTLNGGEQSMLSTLPAVQAAGFRPTVACPADGPLAETLAERGIETAPFSCFDGNGIRKPLAELREELASLVIRVSPDLLHANSLSMGRLSGPVATELGVASIAHLRDIIRLGPQVIKDLNCHRRLLAVSAATRDYHVAQGLDAGKTFVLFNGVDLDRFRPREPAGFLHEELGILRQGATAGLPSSAENSQRSYTAGQASSGTLNAQNAPVPFFPALIAAIGQLGLRKGQEIFVQAAEMIAKQWPDTHFLLIGERCSGKGESREFEAALHDAANGPLAGRLHFLGFRGQMELLLNELTILVHPSRQEPLGRVLLEAAAAGAPIIATNVGGTAEIFPPNSEAAILVPPNDPAAIAAAMEELLQDAEKRGQLRQAARRRAEQAFDLQTAVENLLSHYSAMVGLHA